MPLTETSEIWPALLWLTIGGGLIVYALTGGADLGAGLWSLLASGPRKHEQRRAIRAAIAPIWEANHVWLIFVIVLTFAGFSRAFAALMIALHVPIALSLLGLVFRGSAYVFRAYGIQGKAARAGWERVFAWASAFTPLCLGLVVGGMASGEIRVEHGQITSGYVAGWASWFALAVAGLSLALFALLAAVYLSADTSGALSDDFRRRALLMQASSGALAALTYALAARLAPAFFENFSASNYGRATIAATALCAVVATALSWTRRAALARYATAAQVALVIIGWGIGMRGHFVLPDMSLATASASPQVIPALLAATGLGALLLIPALYYLFRIFKSEPISLPPANQGAVEPKSATKSAD